MRVADKVPQLCGVDESCTCHTGQSGLPRLTAVCLINYTCKHIEMMDLYEVASNCQQLFSPHFERMRHHVCRFVCINAWLHVCMYASLYMCVLCVYCVRVLCVCMHIPWCTLNRQGTKVEYFSCRFTYKPPPLTCTTNALTNYETVTFELRASLLQSAISITRPPSNDLGDTQVSRTYLGTPVSSFEIIW